MSISFCLLSYTFFVIEFFFRTEPLQRFIWILLLRIWLLSLMKSHAIGVVDIGALWK